MYYYKHDKVIVIAKGRGWELAPREGEIWGVNDLILRRNVKIAFHIHDLNNPEFLNDSVIKSVIEKINFLNIPLISTQRYEWIPSSIEYPLKEIISYFGTDYFTCSIDYILAYAIYRGFKKIDLYGVNMHTDSEYAFEKPGVEFWIAMAMGKGLKIKVYGDASEILKTKNRKLYGYEIYQKIKT